MKPAKKKAQEIFNKMYQVDDIMGNYPMCFDTAKKCALIAVDEILDNMMLYQENFDAGKPVHHKSYWESVKQEIEKL